MAEVVNAEETLVATDEPAVSANTLATNPTVASIDETSAGVIATTSGIAEIVPIPNEQFEEQLAWSQSFRRIVDSPAANSVLETSSGVIATTSGIAEIVPIPNEQFEEQLAWSQSFRRIADSPAANSVLLSDHIIDVDPKESTSANKKLGQLCFRRMVRCLLMRTALRENENQQFGAKHFNALEHEITVMLCEQLGPSISCSYYVAVNNHVTIITGKTSRYPVRPCCEFMKDDPIAKTGNVKHFLIDFARACRGSSELYELICKNAGDLSSEMLEMLFWQMLKEFDSDGDTKTPGKNEVKTTVEVAANTDANSGKFAVEFYWSQLSHITKLTGLSPLDALVCLVVIFYATSSVEMNEQNLSQRADALHAAECIFRNVTSPAKERALFFFRSFASDASVGAICFKQLGRFVEMTSDARLSRLACLTNLTILFAGAKNFIFDVTREVSRYQKFVQFDQTLYLDYEERAINLGFSDACLYLAQSYSHISLKTVAHLMLVVEELGDIGRRTRRETYDHNVAAIQRFDSTAWMPGLELAFLQKFAADRFVENVKRLGKMIHSECEETTRHFVRARETSDIPILPFLKCLYEVLKSKCTSLQFINMIERCALKRNNQPGYYTRVMRHFDSMVRYVLDKRESCPAMKQLAAVVIICEASCRMFCPKFCSVHLKVQSAFDFMTLSILYDELNRAATASTAGSANVAPAAAIVDATVTVDIVDAVTAVAGAGATVDTKQHPRRCQ